MRFTVGKTCVQWSLLSQEMSRNRFILRQKGLPLRYAQGFSLREDAGVVLSFLPMLWERS